MVALQGVADDLTSEPVHILPTPPWLLLDCLENSAKCTVQLPCGSRQSNRGVIMEALVAKGGSDAAAKNKMEMGLLRPNTAWSVCIGTLHGQPLWANKEILLNLWLANIPLSILMQKNQVSTLSELLLPSLPTNLFYLLRGEIQYTVDIELHYSCDCNFWTLPWSIWSKFHNFQW